MQPIIECVPNFSEGRDAQKIEAIEGAIASADGAIVLHRTSDPDHNRSVITFAGPPEAVLEGAVRAAAAAAKLIDLRTHKGVHPRLGALDVLPFVPVRGATLDDCIALAHRAGERIWRELSIPVYLYEAAARQPARQRLENVRRGEFEQIREAALADESRQPDIGGPGLHPTAGAVIVGARRFLIAFNINLQTSDLQIAKDIARAIRTSSGGLPAVKALGLPLPSRNLVQVSMNLTDFQQTGLYAVYSEVERHAAQHGIGIAGSELIGLMPREAIEQAAASFLKLESFDSQRIVENRIESIAESEK
jgi:glutamate formiminotransferase/glutamate formiminotransferase/formiminotetrahydrofolate cyclodeaminase